MQKRKLLALCALAALVIQPVMAQQAYPNKPIKLIVGYAPGGSADIAARLAAEKIRQQLNHPVNVLNR
jgi:tripartite-type tricarboxylate transporter receptor subunit TctC